MFRKERAEIAKLVFYYGSMNSSKSAQLLMTAYNFQNQGKSFVIAKSAQDRNSDTIRSRALKLEMPCTPIHTPVELLQLAETERPDWLFIDEVQFMTPDMINTLGIIVDRLDINVVAYGLMTDFQGKLFAGSMRLVEMADSIREVKNQCIHCDNKAIRNMRLQDDKPVFEGASILPGDSYQSVCRKCYEAIRADHVKEEPALGYA